MLSPPQYGHDGIHASANGLESERLSSAEPDHSGCSNNWFESAKHPQKQRKDTIAVDVKSHGEAAPSFRAFFSLSLNIATGCAAEKLQNSSIVQSDQLDQPYLAISPTKVTRPWSPSAWTRSIIPVDAPNFLDRTQGAAQGPGLFGTNFVHIPVSEKLLPNRIRL